jgi:four helix bundle protein
MNYQEWEQLVPVEFTGDPLWKVEAYRLSLFAAELGWHDVTKLIQDKRMFGLSDQLYRALGSISANLAEGYSRGTGKDRARFYEYALGSARESRDWYYKGRHLLGEKVTQHRLSLLTQVIRLLLTMVPQQRGQIMREPTVVYQINSSGDWTTLGRLLNDVPFP